MKLKLIAIAALMTLAASQSLAAPPTHVSGPRYDMRSDEEELERIMRCTTSQIAYDECFWEAILEYKDDLPGVDFSKITPPIFGLAGGASGSARPITESYSNYYFKEWPDVWNLEEWRLHIIDYNATHFPWPAWRAPAFPRRIFFGCNDFNCTSMHNYGSIYYYTNGLPSRWIILGQYDKKWGLRADEAQIIFSCPARRTDAEISDIYAPRSISQVVIRESASGSSNQNGSMIRFQFCRKME